jgi:hypothetical protein
MPINFSNLVLKPCEDTFAIEIEVDPISSRPGAPPYDARAIFTTKKFDMMSMDGAVLSDQQTTLGIRLADFDGPPPLARDSIVVNDFAGNPIGRFLVADVTIDGQGGAVLTIRKIAPDYPR